MASLDDILTTQKNGVVAVNALNQTTINQIGAVTSVTVSDPTVIYIGSGRLVNISVLVGGTISGIIYNATQYEPVPTNDTRLCVVPTTEGVHQIGLLFTNGLTVIPGSGQALNLTYSIG